MPKGIEQKTFYMYILLFFIWNIELYANMH
jgi:hypothetical protein